MAKFYSLQFGAGDPRTFTGLAPTFLIFVRMTDGATIAPPAITESLTSSGIYQFSYGVTQPISFLADAATTSPGAAGRYVVGQIDPVDRMDEVGVTLVAIGTSNIALGTSNIALGTTGVALGTTGVALGITNVALGTTNIALGLTSIALGLTSIALGTTGVALGTTAVALGTTNVALGTTAVAIGVTIESMITGLSLSIGSTASSFGTSSADPTDLFGYMKRIAELIQGQEQFVKGTGVLTMLDRTGGTTFVARTVSNNASLVIKA